MLGFCLLEFWLIRHSCDCTYTFTIDIRPEIWYPFLCYHKQFPSAVRINPFVFIFLHALCRRQKSQLLWNQANPDSFRKTPGVGGTAKIASLESTTSRLFFLTLFASQLRPRGSPVFLCAPMPPWRSNLLPSFSAFASTPRSLRLGVILAPAVFVAPARCGGPLFSQRYELLFPPARRTLGGQPLCIHNHPHCPGGVSPAAIPLATRLSPLLPWNP